MGSTPKKEDESETILTYSPNEDKDKRGYSPLATDNTESNSERSRQTKLRNWKISFAFHMLIPAYGFFIVVIVLFPGVIGQTS